MVNNGPLTRSQRDRSPVKSNTVAGCFAVKISHIFDISTRTDRRHFEGTSNNISDFLRILLMYVVGKC